MDANLEITRTTYKLSDFLSWQRGGNLDLRPPFQRGSVWSNKAKSFFVDSVVRGFPVPLIFIQDQTDPQTYEPKRLVVDGQQRLRTLLLFVDSSSLPDRKESEEFTVLKIHNSALAQKAFADLPREAQRRILDFQFSVHVLPSNTPHATLLEIFARMNATGTKLNPQELRNAGFAGAFKQLAYDLAYGQYEHWIGWEIFSEPQLGRMLEVELTSELVMLLIEGSRGKSQSAIDAAYRSYDDDFPQERQVRRRFASVVEILDSIYGRSTSRRDDTVRVFRKQSWFYSLFALVHDLLFDNHLSGEKTGSARHVSVPRLVAHIDRRATQLASGDIDQDLLKALRGASTDRGSRTQRYQFLKRGWRDAS